MIERSNKSIETKRVTGLVYPKSGSDAANVKYVDDKTSNIQFSSILGKPSIVSSSTQVSYIGLSDIPNGIVSSSTQVSYIGLSDIPNGIVSSSAQITNILSGSNVSQINGASGSITILAGVNVTITTVGNTVTIGSGGTGSISIPAYSPIYNWLFL